MSDSFLERFLSGEGGQRGRAEAAGFAARKPAGTKLANGKSSASEVAVIALDGRATIRQKPEQIVDTIAELLAAGKKIIIFDLTGVMAIDSTGLDRFIVSYGKIRVARVAKLDTVLPVQGNVTEGSDERPCRS